MVPVFVGGDDHVEVRPAALLASLDGIPDMADDLLHRLLAHTEHTAIDQKVERCLLRTRKGEEEAIPQPLAVHPDPGSVLPRTAGGLDPVPLRHDGRGVFLRLPAPGCWCHDRLLRLR